MQAHGLANQLGISVDEATSLIRDYKAAFPTVTKFLDDLGNATKMTMQARTIVGRRRRWEKPTWDSAKERLLADPKMKGKVVTQDMVRKRYVGMFAAIEREGKNMPIQGSNGDLTKRAMFLAWEKLESEYGAFLINSVHDELVVECPADKAEACEAFVSECMRAAGAEWIKGLVMEVEGTIADYWTK